MLKVGDEVRFFKVTNKSGEEIDLRDTSPIYRDFYKKVGKVISIKESHYDKLLESKNEEEFNNNLENLLSAAVSKLGDGALRTNGEIYVPLHIWNTEPFKK